MEIKCELNETEIMQMVLKGATEKEVANELKKRIVDTVIFKLMPTLSKQIANALKKNMQKKNWQDLIFDELKKKINSEVDNHLKDSDIDALVNDYVYDIINTALMGKQIKITF